MAQVSNSSLFKDVEGIHQLKDALIVLVKTEWNADIVDRLEEGCKTLLQTHHIKTVSLTVPGAMEIPFAIQQYVRRSKLPVAYIALACVIRGDTSHFEYVCQSVTNGITQLNLTLNTPVIFGVLTVENIEQANERVGGQHGHKGEEAAVTAIKMALLNEKLKEQEQ